MAQHGYTVEFGFFNGVCFGSKKLPFEVDKTVSEQMVRTVDETILRLRKEIASLKSHPLKDGKVWKYEYFRAAGFGRGKRDGGYKWITVEVKLEATEYGWTAQYLMPEDIHRGVVISKGGWKRYDVFGMYKSEYPTEFSMLVGLNDSYVRHLEKNVDELLAYIEDRRQRNAVWKVEPLIPVGVLAAQKDHVLAYKDGSGYVRVLETRGWGDNYIVKTDDIEKAARYTMKGAKLMIGRARAYKTLEVREMK